MARPVWAGNLSFGLVSQPVGLYTATDSHTIHFHQLQGGTSDRIRNRRVNERTGDEVELDDIVKDYDADGEYFPVEPKELYEIAPVRSRSLEITGFVELAEVDPIFFDKTYHLGPRGAEFGKVYSLLEQALAKAGKEGIATFVMRQHEYLVALKAENGPRRVPRHVPAGGRRSHRGEEGWRDRGEGRTRRRADRRRRPHGSPARQCRASGQPEGHRWQGHRVREGIRVLEGDSEKAAAADLPGRSQTSRDDLVKALSRA
ncbi:putative DNA repair protein YkoV [Streptomyces sp. ADI91-18]|uniref:non-homologous end joining protein Ku n=1 Tax=Streptomyces sp. ADI91-18 TaxID=1522755 RepID=UPI000FC05808|nr:Ku protein [Streptomyces sp. ADI91-18]RPK29289.1 putative DNA repair protein YkoV [Streptomyces sp. ADI91-18]